MHIIIVVDPFKYYRYSYYEIKIRVFIKKLKKRVQQASFNFQLFVQKLLLVASSMSEGVA